MGRIWIITFLPATAITIEPPSLYFWR